MRLIILVFIFLAALNVYQSGAATPTADTVTNSIGMKFKRVPAGTFEMGFEGRTLSASVASMGITNGIYNEHPRHKVTLTQDFYMGSYEVTNTQFKLFRPGHGGDIQWYNSGALVPATRLTWNAADSFCQWLTANDPNGWTYRLPTEAEWEYCCRAGTSTWFSTGDSITAADAAIVPGWGGVVHVGNVGRYAANPFGLYDMHGNAEEWCLDWMGGYPADSMANPGGILNGTIKSIRSMGHYNIFVRTVARGSMPPQTDYSSNLGFRVVISRLTKSELNYYADPRPPEPYQTRVASSRPVPLSEVNGETYVNSEGISFKRVRMSRSGFPMQKDSVVYVSLLPISGDSGANLSLAGLHAQRLSVTYGVLYRLSNRYELACAGLSGSPGHFLTILPDIRFIAGQSHPDAAYCKVRRTPRISAPVPMIGGPVYAGINHNGFIGEAPNGDLIGTWYSTISEDNEESNSIGIRLRLGEDSWDSVNSLITDFGGRCDYDDQWWDNGKGVFYQFHNIRGEFFGAWGRKSLDNGVTWGPYRPLFNSVFGKSFFRLGGDTAAALNEWGELRISTDGGETWPLYPGTVNASSAVYHGSGAILDDGSLFFIARGAFVKNSDSTATMFETFSSDLSRTWTKRASPVFPPGIGHYYVMLKLQSGRLLQAASLGANLVLVESLDSGKTWFCRRKFDGTSAPQLNSSGGYRDMCQGRDGIIHLLCTIGSSGGGGGNLPQVSFSEQWLREGSCLDVAEWGINTAERISPCPDEDNTHLSTVDGDRDILHQTPTLTAAPNPFNPSTVITASLPGAKSGVLTLYDISGKMVRQWILGGGTRRISWDGLAFDGNVAPSGCYFTVLRTASGKVLTDKIIMLK